VSGQSRLLPAREEGRARLLRGFAVQGRVLHALFIYELQTRFGRNSLGFIWMFLEPLLLALAIASVRFATPNAAQEAVSPFLFAVTGYGPYLAFRSIVSRAAGAFRSAQRFLYHSNVTLFDVMVARTLLEAMAVLGVLTLVVGGAAFWAGFAPNNVLILLAGIALIFLFAHGVAMMVASAAALSETVERLVNPLLYLTIPISGALFAMHPLPPTFRNLFLLNPQVHIHEMVRDGMFGDIIPAYWDLGYILAFVIGFNLLGFLAMRAVRPKLEF